MVPATPSLSPEDRSEIDELLARYGFALDFQEWDTLRAVFTADAHIDYSRSTEIHDGIDAIVAFFRRVTSVAGATQHLMHTSQVWATEAGAAGRTHVTAHHVAAGVSLPASEADTFTVTGTYHDEYRRTPDGWRIAVRRNALLTQTGDPAILGR